MWNFHASGGQPPLLPPKIKPPQQKWHHFLISEKGQNSSKQKLYHFRKGSKFVTKIVPFQSKKGQNSSTKIVPFQKSVKIYRQKWYHFRKGSKILNKNGTISLNPHWGLHPTPGARKYHDSFTDIGARCWHDTGVVPTALLFVL